MNDEILFKVALDLSKADNQFKDHSVLWEKHTQDIAKGEKAMQQYADNTVKDYEKINKAVKNQIGQVTDQGKALESLDKKLQSVSKNTKQTFDNKELKQFNDEINKLYKDLGGLDSIDLNLEDMDFLISKLSVAKDDIEAVAIVTDFFQEKLKEIDSSGFSKAQSDIKATKDELQKAKEYLDIVNQTLDDYNQKPLAEKKAETFVDLKQEQTEAKKTVDDLTFVLAEQEQQFLKQSTTSKTLSSDLRKVKDEMAKLELEGQRGSDRWNELTKEAIDYNKAIKDTNEELNRVTKSTAGIDNLIGAVSGLVGVFSAAQGAAALFGNEDEDLQKTLVKLNGAVALLAGLQAVQTEVTKKGTIASKALTFVQRQYTITTNQAATATARLVALSKLLGVGLIIGGIALVVTHWKDISKWIGITSDESERLNAINKSANDLYGEQIAKLKILVERVKEGGLSFKQKQDAVEDYNKVFGETFGIVKTYTELEKKLIEQGADYIAYLGLKAQAEAAYQLAVEKSKEALEKRNSTETNFGDYLKSFTPLGGALKVSPEVNALIRNAEDANVLEKESDDFLKVQTEREKKMEALGKKMGLTFTKTNNDIIKEYEKLSSVLESLIKKQEDYRIGLIENNRDREIALANRNVDLEKETFKKQIDDLKLNEKEKQKLREDFNKIYNQETGLAYEELRKTIQGIDEKYNEELEKVQFNALSAIANVYNTESQLEREQIEKKWDDIRTEIQKQIDQTNDAFKKQELEVTLNYSTTAEDQELSDFDINTNLDRVDREKEIADAILKIYQANNKDIINNEKLKELQLLVLQKNYLDEVLQTYQEGLQGEDIGLFDGLLDTIKNSDNVEAINEAAQKLREAFGESMANEILETVGALKEVAKSIDDIDNSKFKTLIDDLGAWTSSLESFSRKLAETLGLQGKSAEEFASGVATAIESTFDSLNTIFQLEIEQQREKLDAIQESIDTVEEELDRERQLYEDGYANNYEARQKDLESLKEQKKKEEEELRKAQKQKAILAKAELVADSVSQLGNMITASTNIFKWASKIPFVGVPLAIGLIATMFGAFAIAKTKAFQAIGSGQKFRRGLEEGPLELNGPRHEEKGFGLYNSKTGERVAEFEDGEDIYVANRQQKRKYKHVLDALIADAMGRGNLDSTLERYYAPKVGETTMQIVKHVNIITVKAEKSKEEASTKNDDMVKELVKLNKNFEKEFEGYKNERDNEVKAWETPEYYYVRKGNTTKKYRKKP